MKTRGVIIMTIIISFLSIYISSVIADHIYNGVTFGGYVEMGVEPDWGNNTYDSVIFGGYVDMEQMGDWTSNSSYWEFYKLDNRYNMNNDSFVNSLDVIDIWNNRSGLVVYDYLYDVEPLYSGDGLINTLDVIADWNNRGPVT